MLTLKPLTSNDAEHLFELLRDPSIYRFIPENAPASLESLRERYRILEIGGMPPSTDLWLNWVVMLGDDPIGTTQATVSQDNSAVIAFVISPDFQGCGHGQEAVRKMLHVLRRDHCVDHVKAFVDTRNLPSQKLLKSLGFALTGFSPDADAFKGSASDEFIFEAKL